jgi:hypothetical protein
MRFVHFILAAVLVLFFTGCMSTKAQIIRSEFAWESETLNRDNAGKQHAQVRHFIAQATQTEINRLNDALADQNDLAGGDVQMVAQNYIRYYAALDALRAQTQAEYETAASLHAEQVALGRGFRVLSRMADTELQVARDTANAAITEAIRVANVAWVEYQRRQPPPVPDPVPEPEPVIIEVPVEVPAPAPEPTPAPAPE